MYDAEGRNTQVLLVIRIEEVTQAAKCALPQPDTPFGQKFCTAYIVLIIGVPPLNEDIVLG